MEVLNLTEVNLIIKKRQRSTISQGPLNELCESIAERGLLHPPTVFPLGGKDYLLVAGERRTKAIQKLHSEGRPFFCDARSIAKDELPVLFTDVELIIDQKQLEYDENHLREALDWRDRCTALAEIHNLKQQANPTQKRIDTAKDLIEKGSAEVTAREVKNPRYLAIQIREAATISEHLYDPTIANARNATEAYALILKKQEERANAIIARRRLAAMPKDAKPKIEIRHGDLYEILPGLDGGFVDLILADPPYGIEASGGGFRSRTVHHHNYTDDIDSAKAAARIILTEGFRVTKPRANLLLFTDIKHWDWLQNISASIGWVPFRTPIVWKKSESEGLAPWGSMGPRRTFEMIFYATKGQRGMVTSPTDIWEVKRVSRKERIHAAEKPVELLLKGIECCTLPGDFILDPCCGSGSSLVAAREAHRVGLGIEKDDTFYYTAMSNVFKNGEGLDATTSEAVAADPITNLA